MLTMRLIKYISLMNKLSRIEGRKESLKGQLNLSAKLLKRGDINEEIFLQQSDTYNQEMRTLDTKKRTAIRHYLAA